MKLQRELHGCMAFSANQQSHTEKLKTVYLLSKSQGNITSQHHHSAFGPQTVGTHHSQGHKNRIPQCSVTEMTQKQFCCLLIDLGRMCFFSDYEKHRSGRWNEVFLKEFRKAGLAERYRSPHCVHTRVKGDLRRRSTMEKSQLQMK